jgi:hypothetical protein
MSPLVISRKQGCNSLLLCLCGPATRCLPRVQQQLCAVDRGHHDSIMMVFSAQAVLQSLEANKQRCGQGIGYNDSVRAV